MRILDAFFLMLSENCCLAQILWEKCIELCNQQDNINGRYVYSEFILVILRVRKGGGCPEEGEGKITKTKRLFHKMISVIACDVRSRDAWKCTCVLAMKKSFKEIHYCRFDGNVKSFEISTLHMHMHTEIDRLMH